MWIELLLLGSLAHGYDLHGNTWAWQDEPVEDGFELNVQSFSDNYDPADVGAAWSLALDVWNAEGGAPFYMPNNGTSTLTKYGGGDDDHNVTQWVPSASFGASSLASSIYNSNGDDLIDCDIKFYGSNRNGPITWSMNPEGAVSGEFDLTHTAIHELGHCIGFSHSSDSNAVMFSTNGSGTGWERRNLSADDQAGLQAMYGQGQLDLVEDGLVLVDDNGDGLVQPGELVFIELTLRNAGNAPAVDVMGILSSTDSQLAIDQTAFDLGDLPPGYSVGTVADLMVFSATVDAGCEDATEAVAEVQVTDWFGDLMVVPVSIPLDCPSTQATGTTVNGGVSGEDGGGCGCVNSGPAPWGAIALLLPLFLRRRSG